FQVTRAYLNVTGTITPLLSFRITPDVARESGGGSSISGSQPFRLKYAYGQVNLDPWTTKGSWLRFGVQQTPYLDFAESTYRYRFQGTLFGEREGFLTSSDNGVSVHYNLPGDRGDVHAGYYNGEGYARMETNDEKAFQIRATLRPLSGLKLTAFADFDHSSANMQRSRWIASATYEHPRGNAGFEYLGAHDLHDARGWSAYATPKIANGFEALLRYDTLQPDTHSPATRTRDIVGVSYWMRRNAAVLVDRDHANTDTRFGVHVLLTF
ncbi:MAG TPA: hypothetical protein VN181_00630, partial [Thermoanaerobaculia bacterium]|nr:hypothetical protein [Thermoanaerobaculia bacterium]